jgi:hypothetical protein
LTHEKKRTPPNDCPSARDAAAVRETLGHPGRMIASSKSGYRELNPTNVAVFNSDVVLSPRKKAWGGDMDVTLSEPKLLELARRTGSIVYVLYEGDGRFYTDERPLLEDAVFSITPSGHTRFPPKYLERAADGTLRRRPQPKPKLSRFVFTFGRPRLFRFWKWEMRRAPAAHDRSVLFYVGRLQLREGRRRWPFLVLGFQTDAEGWGCEWTWYPTPKRHAHRPLIRFTLKLPVWFRRPWIQVVIQPRLVYEFWVAVDRRPRRRGW